jgi:kexin
MRALLICAALLALTGCGGGGGGGGGDDDKGGGGGTGGSVSISAIDSAFPSGFNEDSLGIEYGYAEKWYYYGSTSAPTQYKTTLQGKSFRNDSTTLAIACGAPYDYYKVDGAFQACADIGNNGEADFKALLFKDYAAPSDSELNSVFGSVPGWAYYVERVTVAAYGANFTYEANSYKSVLIANSFECTGSDYGISCRKASGNLAYKFQTGKNSANTRGFAVWSVYGGGGYPSAEASCPVTTETTTYFESGDYRGLANAIFAQLDPLGVYQWHLKNWGQKSGSYYRAKTANEDLNVVPVWNSGIKGSGVTIGIVDSGTDFTHPDLAPAYRQDLSFNYYPYSLLNNPYPAKAGTDCPHGTMTAGIAGARGSNNYGVMGVAPEADLAGLNIGFGCGFDAYGAAIIDALGAKVDISSNSWGATSPTPNIPEYENAIIEGAEYGRKGSGTIYVFSAGNDRTYISGNSSGWRNGNGNYDATKSLFQSISVAALASDGTYAKYSNKGANTLVSAYGASQTSLASFASADDAWIFTTDIYGCAKGDNLDYHVPHSLNNFGQFTAYMNGTSAAAPMVSGVVALMLNANENLTWRDVRYILATTARKNDPTDTDWKLNGASWNINHNYGFGAVDAFEAVKKAKIFTSLGNLKRFDENKTVSAYTDFSSTQKSTITVPAGAKGVDKIEFVEVMVDIDDSTTSTKLNITLKSPSGTESELAYNDYTGVWPKNLFNGGRRFGTARHLDEIAEGDWTLTISGGSGSRTFNKWGITIYGRSN